MGRPQAIVMGAGLVGLTGARLLLASGWSVRVYRTGPPPHRPIALAEHSLRMIEDIWDCRLQPLCDHHRLSGRQVSWGPGARLSWVPAPGLALDVAALSVALQARLQAEGGRLLSIEDVPARMEPPRRPHREPLVIDARGAAPPAGCRLVCGRRAMQVWPELPADPSLTGCAEVCAGREAWVFLLPVARDRICLQIATPSGTLDRGAVSEALATAGERSLAAGVHGALGEVLARPAMTVGIAPRFGPAPGHSGHLPAGDRAMTFDPMCGDGSGQGVKSALLAVAAANALTGGSVVIDQRVARHVASRHAFAFRSHLEQCAGYYRALGVASAWSAEVAASLDGIAGLEALGLRDHESFRMRFDGRPMLEPEDPTRSRGRRLPGAHRGESRPPAVV